MLQGRLLERSPYDWQDTLGNMQEVRGSYPALHDWPCAGNAMYLAFTNVWGDLAGL